MGELKLQSDSRGIEIDHYTGGYRICEFRDEGVNSKDELYLFRCSAEKFCCGGECCVHEPDVLPLWALILLLLLLVLFILCVACAIFYLLKKRKNEKLKVTTVDLERNRIEIRKAEDGRKNGRAGEREILINHTKTELASVTDFDSSVGREPSSEHYSSDHTQIMQLTSVSTNNDDTMDSRLLDKDVNRHRQRFPAAVPVSIKETYERPPTPIAVSYHADTEQRPVVSELKTEERKAQLVYYTPSVGKVAAYNDDFQEN